MRLGRAANADGLSVSPLTTGLSVAGDVAVPVGSVLAMLVLATPVLATLVLTTLVQVLAPGRRSRTWPQSPSRPRPTRRPSA